MSVILTLALAAAAAAPLPDCSWDHPGRDRYTGTTQAAVDRYTDMPPTVRVALKQRMQEHRYDDVATIRRDSIEGRQRYGSELRDMHFGTGRVCNSVSRSGWSADHVERGLVYCEGAHCLIVPAVCGNVSRVSRAGPAVAGPAPGGRGDGAQAVAGAEPLAPSGGPGAGAAPPAFDAVPGSGSTPTSTDGTSFAAAAAPAPGFVQANAFFGTSAPYGGIPAAVLVGNASSVLSAGTTIDGGLITAVPEPGTSALWLGGGALLAWRARRRRDGR